jgi:hypothetical protein
MRRLSRGLYTAASLGGGQALLLFPEGANFTWPRRHYDAPTRCRRAPEVPPLR